jgi:hypothetical protein
VIEKEREIMHLNKEMLSMDLTDVSVEELEQRLELAIAIVALPPCTNHTCDGYSCPRGGFDIQCDGFLCTNF